MGKEKVVSREYKIMLRAQLFAGDERRLLEAARKFWQDFSHLIENVVIDIDGNLEEVTNRRLISFYDTDRHILYSNNYIFRERYDLDGGEREVTLKFRHPDRYISQGRNLESRYPDKKIIKDDVYKAQIKFEEDIKPTFLQLYSFSGTQTIDGNKNFHAMKDIVQVFCDISDKVDDYIEDERIKIIGSTTRELVITGAKLQISKKPRLHAECAVIIWYNNHEGEEKPVVVEFSFRYGHTNEKYTRTMAQRVYDVFQLLQAKLTHWVDPTSETKTAYVYH